VISLIPSLCLSQQCLIGYDAEGPRPAEQRMPLSSRSVRKLQRSLDRLEARLVAQRIEEGVNFRVRDSKPGIKVAADSDREVAARGTLPDQSPYWTLIVVSFFVSTLLFGTCTVSTPSFDSARIASASIPSGSAKLREKLP
jgi:hypothetical protein